MADESFGVIPFRKTETGLEFLLVKHAQGHWGFPKGHPIGNESHIETALRELKEETGVTDCNIIGDKTWKQKYTIEKSGNSTEKIVEYFLGEVLSANKNVDSKEILECRWCNFEDAIELLSHPESKGMLESVFSFINPKR